jgi:hypothetical protein
MNQQRLGVTCKHCGQPIVLLDGDASTPVYQERLSRSIVMRCISCGQHGSYRKDVFQTFQTADLASGDWEAAPPYPRANSGAWSP